MQQPRRTQSKSRQELLSPHPLLKSKWEIEYANRRLTRTSISVCANHIRYERGMPRQPPAVSQQREKFLYGQSRKFLLSRFNPANLSLRPSVERRAQGPLDRLSFLFSFE